MKEITTTSPEQRAMMEIGESCKRPARLECWSVVGRSSNDFLQLPELMTCHLHGEVYGHRRFSDGTPITTSIIAGRRGEQVVTVAGTLYDLGEVDPAYEAMCPNARARLMERLKELP